MPSVAFHEASLDGSVPAAIPATFSKKGALLADPNTDLARFFTLRLLRYGQPIHKQNDPTNFIRPRHKQRDWCFTILLVIQFAPS